MASFGIAFAVAWSRGVRTASWWSGAFFALAGGFAVPTGFPTFHTAPWGVLTGLLFACSFLLLSQALLERWRPSWLLRTRIAICAISVFFCILAAVIDDPSFGLAVSHFGGFLLITLPLIAGKDHLTGGSDRALFGATTLTAFDILIRGITTPLVQNNGGPFPNGDHSMVMQALTCICGLFLALSALAATVLDLLARYRHDAMVDPLSGLLNRRGFDDAVTKLERQGSMIVCDIDHFKAVNDEYGHPLGDRVIVALAALLDQFSPKDTVAARFGGEEFVLFLPGINAARAGAVANDIREAFAEDVGAALGLARGLTASFGLSSVQQGDPSIHDAITRADAALYEAKARGRNRVCVRRALSAPQPLPLNRLSRARA